MLEITVGDVQKIASACDRALPPRENTSPGTPHARGLWQAVPAESQAHIARTCRGRSAPDSRPDHPFKNRDGATLFPEAIAKCAVSHFV
jgi:hypothetical protein